MVCLSEYESYVLQYYPLKPKQGELSDPLYFDFISESRALRVPLKLHNAVHGTRDSGNKRLSCVSRNKPCMLLSFRHYTVDVCIAFVCYVTNQR